MVAPTLTLRPTASTGARWPQQGQWTYDDYLRLPDEPGVRYEIIEGVLYVTNAPNFLHQYAVSQLSRVMGNFVMGRKLGVVLTAPFEVHLSRTARPVHPDVLFIAAARQPKADAKIFEGAPDLVAEVLSASTLRQDRKIKFDAYERAGAQDYWLLDPKTRSVEVYTLSNGEYALLGQWSAGETANSTALAGFEVAVEELFAPTG